VTSHLYGSPEGYGLPLKRLLRHPVHASDGTLSVKDGYDASTENYFDLRGLKVGHIPEKPSRRMVRWAVKVFTDHLLVDFPFSDGFSTALVDENGNRVPDTGEGSRAHALAMILDPFVQGLVDGPTPLYAIDKPKAGTGATKLAKCAHIIATGGEVEPTPLPVDDTREVRLTLMGLLLASIAEVFFDNVEAKFEDPAMLAYATGTGLSGRILGEQRVASLTRRNRTILTGNKLAPGEQMARRILAIYLNARVSEPELRKGFKYPDIEKLALDRRRIFIRAALIIVQNWFAQDRPMSDVEFGSYEKYAAIMGGVLEAAGVSGFLANRTAFYEAKRTEQADVTDFIQALYDGLNDKEKLDGFGKVYADSIAYTDGSLQFGCLKIGDVFGDEARRSKLASYIGMNLLGTYTLTKPGTGEKISVELVKGKRQKDGVRWLFMDVPVQDG
jgi:hypothetical protein